MDRHRQAREHLYPPYPAVPAVAVYMEGKNVINDKAYKHVENSPGRAELVG